MNTFENGCRYERNRVTIELLRTTDKIETIKALFGKTSNLAFLEKDKDKAAELKAYSEGFRHALNILRYYGNAIEAYNGIINPSIKVELTREDVIRFS